MDELQQTRKRRFTPFSQQDVAPPDESGIWMGGEASVGTQARRYVRETKQNTPGLALTILGLTFFGGLAMGAVASRLLRKTRP